ncbi:MAG: sigma 54-interacting transcriptional regulator [Deltaproteobacteria bacterium]|jgi:DNA-binding NtrC family response regulator|nr:sigma 54-interacting transcriptional regulator [Deltaproteobacteria bacterium]
MIVGRAIELNVYIEDQSMSRRHAVLRFTRSSVLLEDLGSHNGTFLNGTRIDGEQSARYGDIIRCGNSLLMPVADIGPFKQWPRSADQPVVAGPTLQKVLDAAQFVAPQDIDVLISGESGTGKELLAGYLHEQSGRAGPLVAVNCAAIPEALFESELFGAKRGAYTGASEQRAGLIAAAHKGTLFLDEVGEMPLALQAKLLRAVELREVRQVGSDRSIKVNTRFVAATNRDLAAEAKAGNFREDLLHRLCGVTLQLPPLRQRREDIVIFARRFLAEAATDVAPKDTATEYIEALLLQSWPGNVRQLRKAVRESFVRAHLEGAPQLESHHLAMSGASPVDPGSDPESQRIRQALQESGGNVAQAATLLGIGRSKLYRQLKALGISPNDFRRDG